VVTRWSNGSSMWPTGEEPHYQIASRYHGQGQQVLASKLARLGIHVEMPVKVDLTGLHRST
jgi:hypothetical protein